MRRSLTVWVVAAITILWTAVAWAGSADVADQIAKRIRGSGQLKGYKIAVSYENGTAQLAGQVSTREQMAAALKMAIETPGVERVVNNMRVGAGDAKGASGTAKIAAADAKKPPTTPSVGQLSAAHATLTSRVQPRQGNISEKRIPQRPASPAVAGKASYTEQAPAGRDALVRQTGAASESGAIYAEPTPRTVQQGSQPRPIPIAYAPNDAVPAGPMPPRGGAPLPMYTAAASQAGVAPVRYDQPSLPNYAWPSYAAYPNYAAVTYPKQYSPTAWPYIGPFYPYPQVPLGWRKVSLEWDDGWWMLDFRDRPSSWEGPLGRWY